jgi:hypothetical protein
MVIDGANDPFISREDAAAWEQAIRARREQGAQAVYWRLEYVSHVMAIAADPDEYQRRLESFLRNVDARAHTNAKTLAK